MDEGLECRPAVSINCLAYNHERYIRRCLDGFVTQEAGFRFEAVVHDDASTDGTAAIIREYERKYPGIIRPIYETENQYSKQDGSLRRIMEAACTGKYVAFCEGDDFWTDPMKLQRQYEAMEAHPECTICFCKVNKVDRDGKPLGDTIPNDGAPVPAIVTLKDFIYNEYYLGNWILQTSSFFIRREMYRKFIELTKTVFRSFPFGDIPLLLTCFLYGKGFYLPEAMSNYTVYSGGYSSSMKANLQKRICNQKKAIQAYRDFDAYTEREYHAYLERGILRRELLNHVDERHFGKLFSRRYWFRYKERGIGWTLYTMLRTVSPKCAEMLKKLRH